MEIYPTLASVFTVLSFCVFLGIVAWAWSGRRKQAFDAAARAPFALPDEAPGVRPTAAPGSRQ